MVQTGHLFKFLRGKMVLVLTFEGPNGIGLNFWGAKMELVLFFPFVQISAQGRLHQLAQTGAFQLQAPCHW